MGIQKEELTAQDSMASKCRAETRVSMVKGSPDALSVVCHFILTSLLPGGEY